MTTENGGFGSLELYKNAMYKKQPYRAVVKKQVIY